MVKFGNPGVNVMASGDLGRGFSIWGHGFLFGGSGEYRWLEVSKTSDAAARLRDAGNEVAAHRIGYPYEYDRNDARLGSSAAAAGVELPRRTSGCNATSSLANRCASSGLAGAKR